MRVSGPGGLYKTYPDGMRFTLIPDMWIPVPTCNRNIHNNISMPESCFKDATPPPWRPPSFTPSQSHTTKIIARLLINSQIHYLAPDQYLLLVSILFIT